MEPCCMNPCTHYSSIHSTIPVTSTYNLGYPILIQLYTTTPYPVTTWPHLTRSNLYTPCLTLPSQICTPHATPYHKSNMYTPCHTLPSQICTPHATPYPSQICTPRATPYPSQICTPPCHTFLCQASPLTTPVKPVHSPGHQYFASPLITPVKPVHSPVHSLPSHPPDQYFRIPFTQSITPLVASSPVPTLYPMRLLTTTHTHPLTFSVW